MITEEIPDPCEPPCGWVHRRLVTPDEYGVHDLEPYCGVYWIITTCLTGIALGLGFGALAWLVLA